MTATRLRTLVLLVAAGALAACDRQPPPPNPIQHDVESNAKTQTQTKARAAAVAFNPEAYNVHDGRSPLLQEGETFEALIPPRPAPGAEKVTHVDPPKPGQIVPWYEAKRYVGYTITVEGTIVDTHKARTICFLNFHEDWRGRFYMVIFDDDFGDWPQSPDEHFLNRKVRVTGEIELHRGRPQLKIREPSQVEFVD